MSDRFEFSRRLFLAGAAAPALTIAGESTITPHWIWIPCQRTLPSTFVLFRKTVKLPAQPVRCVLHIAADSRYKLFVNGQRVQWGPAPCDPRWLDIDQADISRYLRPGDNVIGAEVLYYGAGDGTWPAGRPGLLVYGDIELPGGGKVGIGTDRTWHALLDRAHPPGQHKRWFLRALQEQFDARLHPHGWHTTEFIPDARWLEAMELPAAIDKPPVSAGGPYAGDTIDRVPPQRCALRPREIPPVAETVEPVLRLAEAGLVEWLRDPDDWFDMRIPGSFRLTRGGAARRTGPAEWELPNHSWATFEFPVQMVGFPLWRVEAAAGTILDVMPQESHDPRKTAWLDTHHYSWSRVITREGWNDCELFDYESLRWLQFSVRNATRPVRLRDVGLRRRQFPWPQQPRIQTSEPALQKLFDATVNTLRNSVIETAVDGMGRERQQYSGDGSHQLHAVRYSFGEVRAPRRFLRTFSQGQMKEGYFADSWPAYDRLARLQQKQMDGAYWGPLLDHGTGFHFDCWNHYLETGETEVLEEVYPRLQRFTAYLASQVRADGMLAVEDLGIPTVWMDHQAYKQQRHKQCSFNLYVAAMLTQALAPLAEVMKDPDYASECRQRGARLLQAVTARYWSRERGLFVDNLPWSAAEGGIRLSDRTLAMSILFGQCPAGETRAAVAALARCPAELGLSYPCNAGWRYQALARAGVVQPILDDFRRRWATMRSVTDNGTIQEDWEAPTDGGAQWSHCAAAPLFVTYMDLAGIRPLEPGFRRCRIRPQLGDLQDLQLTAHTVRGPIEFAARAEGAGHRVRIALPPGCTGELMLPDGSTRALASQAEAFIPGSSRRANEP